MISQGHQLVNSESKLNIKLSNCKKHTYGITIAISLRKKIKYTGFLKFLLGWLL